jgi:hypothetical protein
MEYQSSIEFNRQIKAFHKKERDLVAQAYRHARRENREIARLMFRAAQHARARVRHELETALFSDHGDLLG